MFSENPPLCTKTLIDPITSGSDSSHLKLTIFYNALF